MIRKVSGVLVVAGCLWLLWLYLGSPKVSFVPFRDQADGLTVSCEPLGSLGRDAREPDDLLPTEQAVAVSEYIEHARRQGKGEPGDESRKEAELTKLHARIEQVMVISCERARQNRLAHLGLVAFITMGACLVALRPGVARTLPSGGGFGP